ncbi:MAG: TetR/AcrR family transcriptional regulator [Acutalibacteraceae bacterium]
MYFEEVEKNRTKLWIINSLLDLLKRKEYTSITINMIADNTQLGRRTFYRHFNTKDEAMKYITQLLMDEFANHIKSNNAKNFEEILTAYFEFWEQYIDVLLLLKKAHLLYFIEDNLPELIVDVAKKINHIPKVISLGIVAEHFEKYKYEFTIKLAGLWRATIIWCEESPRKSPQEMVEIITKFLK